MTPKKSIAGVTLIELLLYMGLVSIIMGVLYESFALVGERKIVEVVYDEIYVNAEYIHRDIQYTIKNATSVTAPAVGASSATLSLNSGTTMYSVDGSGILQKTDDGNTAPLTTSDVFVESLTFTAVGPSGESPSVVVVYTIRSAKEVQGTPKSVSFRTAVTLR